MSAAGSVPVPVLEALASAWEEKAAQNSRLAGPGSSSLMREAHAERSVVYARCARMLREAITKAAAGTEVAR